MILMAERDAWMLTSKISSGFLKYDLASTAACATVWENWPSGKRLVKQMAGAIHLTHVCVVEIQIADHHDGCRTAHRAVWRDRPAAHEPEEPVAPFGCMARARHPGPAPLHRDNPPPPPVRASL